MDGNEIRPTRESDQNEVEEAVLLSQIDQHVSEIADKLKAGIGYQLTFTVRFPDKAPINYFITNNFQKDISLRVHRECRDLITDSLEK